MKIGVYICECGINIAKTVDVPKVVESTGKLENVATAKYYKYMCSEPGQELIKKDIKELALDRVVVASCSPRMHESTFRNACQEAGLNPYCFEMANIREQCSWVHEDREKATEKAQALVSAAAARASLLEPISEKIVNVTDKALVLGGGIAGIQAALDIANVGHKVYLVEASPSIGGRMAQLDKTFPTLDCSACILTPKMVDVLRNKNIELLTYSEIASVEGYVGNFKVKVKKRAKYIDEAKCTGCGACAQTEISSSNIITVNGYQQVDRLKINEEKCIQCGDCVDVCIEENKEKHAMSNMFVERKRQMFGEEPSEIVQIPSKTLLEEIHELSPHAKAEFWEKQFSKCIKCYSCREACPLCVCTYCELEDPKWVKPGEIPPDYPIFHIIRAYHLAGKCIGCGECEKACPMGIPLRAIQDMVRGEPPERIFDFVPGLSRRMQYKLIKFVKKYPIDQRRSKI